MHAKMSSDEKKRKITIIAFAGTLLVVMVGTVSYGVSRPHGDSQPNGDYPISESAKAIKAICEPTCYKETCESSLASANTSDPKELIKVAFQAAIINISEAIEKSSLLKEVSMNPMTSQALDICKDVLNSAIKDIHSSIHKIGSLDLSKLDPDNGDLKTWIGGAITFRETCLDGFENLTDDTGEKMKKLLRTAGQLISNALSMVSTYIQMFGQLQIPTTTRRLLQDRSDGFPSFVDVTSRRLLANSGPTAKPNATVALDGSGQFTTIQQALKTVPEKNNEPFIIFIKAGVYKENVLIPSSSTRVVLIGEGPTKTKVTGDKNYADGTQTYYTATVAVEGNYFIAKDIGFENSAGPTKHQAVALRVTGDNAVFFNCQIDGYQDTLLAHNFRQFYRDCTITGTIDFVFGDAQAIFQNCKFIVRKPLPNQACMVTAQGKTDKNGPGAIIIQNCQILAAPDFHEAGTTVKAYLGRPWKSYSTTIIMNSFIDSFIAPEGWSPWSGNKFLDTLYFGEYQNKGPGANSSQRVKWKGIQNITHQIAESFTPGKYYNDAWIKAASVPYDTGIKST